MPSNVRSALAALNVRSALAALSMCCLVTQALASVPVQLLPFINYYEVYLEPYTGLMTKLRGVSI